MRHFWKLAAVGLLGAIVIGFSGNIQSATGVPNGNEAGLSRDVALPDYGLAPELLSTAWLNTDKPLRLFTLRGRVVLLEFWTFSCINCIHTLPYMQAWYSQYHEKGLSVIGNHYPEYSFEREINNVAASLKERGITYPIAQDNTGKTWAAYNQRYWPTIYVIDKIGHIRFRSYGEGNYENIEQAIKTLLAEESPIEVRAVLPNDSYITLSRSVDVYRQPASGSELLGAVGMGMTFMVLETREGWYKISYNDSEGYIAGDSQGLTYVH